MKTTQSQHDLRYAVGTPYGDGPIKIVCPFHEDDTPSFAVYADGAKCFGCGAYLTPAKFVEHYGTILAELPLVGSAPRTRRGSSKGVQDVATSVEFWHRTLTEGPRQNRLMWFQQRGFLRRSIEQFKFGHDGDCFIIPLWDRGKIVGFKRRKDPLYADPDDLRQRKYLNVRGVSAGIIIPDPAGSPLILTEGELDAYLLVQYGVCAATPTSGSDSFGAALEQQSRQLQGLADRKGLYIATDLDAAGEAAADTIRQAFPNTPVRTLRWDTGNDISEYLCSVDVGERSSALRRLIEGATP